MLPFVESHIMEHGLLMLSGEGIYRLGDEWHPVRSGDVIWDGALLPAVVCRHGQNTGQLYLLQGCKSQSAPRPAISGLSRKEAPPPAVRSASNVSP